LLLMAPSQGTFNPVLLFLLLEFKKKLTSSIYIIFK